MASLPDPRMEKFGVIPGRQSSATSSLCRKENLRTPVGLCPAWAPGLFPKYTTKLGVFWGSEGILSAGI